MTVPAPTTTPTGRGATLPGGSLRSLALGFVADAAAVFVFAAVGRRTHDGVGGIGGVVSTAAPFLIALGAGWIAASVVSARLGGSPRKLLLRPDWGVNLAVGTTTLGMLLRRAIWGDGTAVAFIVVAAMFLVAAFAGWRALAARFRRDG